VGDLLRELQLTSLLEGSGDLKAKLDASGASPQAMARSLGGQVSFLMADGRLRTELVDRLAPGMRQLLGTLVTGKPADVTSLRCLALAMPIAEGVARPRLVLDSEVSTLVGTGSIDLGRETLDITVVPRAKVADLNVALPVTVRGPLMAPSFGIDREGAARRVASLLGAAVFPPEVMGTFAEPDSGGGNECLTLASDPARSPLPGLGAVVPAEVLRNPEKALDAAKGALGKAGQGLLENFLGGR
jgi:uncharacterized protein involved in outer membrane biogenesis